MYPSTPYDRLIVTGGLHRWCRGSGCPVPPPEPAVGARLARAVASALRDGVAHPLFGAPALLSVLTRADGYVIVPEPATGLDADADLAGDPEPLKRPSVLTNGGG